VKLWRAMDSSASDEASVMSRCAAHAFLLAGTSTGPTADTGERWFCRHSVAQALRHAELSAECAAGADPARV